ncbi:MAG: M81 family metallopeptidase [Hyphomicrobiaceae bacterium]
MPGIKGSTMRLFAASLATETNTFSPIPTSRSSFEEFFYAPPGEHPEAPKLCSAPLLVARRRALREDFTLIEGSSFWAEPSGTVDQASYESMRNEILDQLTQSMPLDGVLMGFHGAFVADGYDDAEGDMLERIRAVVGPNCVVGCEYDPHCHLTEKRVTLAEISILFKEYPHIDFMDRADELVTLVLRTIKGEISPVASLYDPRLIDFYPTTTEPMRGFVDDLKALEQRNDILSVSIAHGFMHSDVRDMGSRVLVYTDGHKAEGDRLAKQIGDKLWAQRGKWSPRSVTLDAALDEALSSDDGLVIIAEPADNAGGGATSDNTLSLHALRERRARNVAIAPVWDPIAVSFCHKVGAGARLSMRLGGKAAPGPSSPVDANLEVIGVAANTWQHFGDAVVPVGDAAVVRIDNAIDVILISNRTQAFGLELFTHFGLSPTDYRLLVLKSAQHFAAAFGPLASKIIRAQTGGCCPTDPHEHIYTNVARPLWPLDDNVEGRHLL